MMEMDIEATKLELIKMLLHSRNEDVLRRIKEVFEQEEGKDFWDVLSKEDQAAIQEGLDQLNRGEHISHAEVKEKIRKGFNF